MSYMGDFGSKVDLKSSHLLDEEEETRVLIMIHKREKGKREITSFFFEFLAYKLLDLLLEEI